MVKNFLKNNELSIHEAEQKLLSEALGRLDAISLTSFEQKSAAMLEEYYSHPELALSAESFRLDKLEAAKEWVEYLSNAENKNKFMPLIVDKMMNGDPFANSLFTEIYKTLGQTDLLFSDDTFNKFPALLNALENSEAGVDSRAIIQGQHWINSDEGKEVLCAGASDLKTVETLIGTEC